MNKSELAIARGIGIIVVVLGHIPSPSLMPSQAFYHLPLFFFLGGVALREGVPWGKSVSRLVLGAIGWTVLWTFIYAILSAALIWAGGPNYLRTGLNPIDVLLGIWTKNNHHVPLVLPLWFMTAFGLSCFFADGALRILHRAGPLRLIVLAALGVASIYVGAAVLGPAYQADQTLWYYNLASQTAVGFGFVLLGWVLTNAGFLAALTSGLMMVAFYFATLWVRWAFELWKPPVMSWSNYPSKSVPLLVMALMSIFVVLGLAKICARADFGWLEKVGASSRSIMTHHLAVFAIINTVLVAFGVMNAADVKPLEGFDPPRWSWAYVALALFIPTALAPVASSAWSRTKVALSGYFKRSETAA